MTELVPDQLREGRSSVVALVTFFHNVSWICQGLKQLRKYADEASALENFSLSPALALFSVSLSRAFVGTVEHNSG